MLSPTAHADTQTHTNTHSCTLREAQQEQLAKKKKNGGGITMALFEEYNEYSSV